MSWKQNWLLILALLLVTPAGLYATTTSQQETSCPVCSNVFSATVWSTTNTFGGQDRDFLARARGTQTILIDPITCSNCLYSGFHGDFDKDIKISEDIKTRILKEKVLRPCLEIKKEDGSNDIMAWVKYDLIAQTYQLHGKDSRQIPHIYLMASWAVRLSTSRSKVRDDNLSTKIDDFIKNNWQPAKDEPGKNDALEEIENGKKFYQLAQLLEGEKKLIASFAAISLLREHGENTMVLQILNAIKELMPPKQYEPLQKLIADSIVQERHFQNKAASLFEEIIKDEKNNQEKAALNYLCGELYRRQEHWDKARDFYRIASEIKECPEIIAQYIKEQLKLLPEK